MAAYGKPNDPNNPYRVGQVVNGRTICGAQTMKETPCTQPPMSNGRCRRHGGKTPSGIASPHYKGKGWQRHRDNLPPGLGEKYEQYLIDPALRELAPEIALLDTRIDELESDLENKEEITRKEWSALRKLWVAFFTASTSGRQAEASKAFNELNAFISADRSYGSRWDDIADMVERRRKLIDTEQRRLMMSQQVLTIEQAMMMLAATINALREAVYLYADPTTSRHILGEAQKRYATIVSLPAPNPSGSAKSLGEAAE